MTQITKYFDASPVALHRWMKIAEKEDGVKSGAVSDDAAKLREANKRIRLLEQARCLAAGPIHGQPG